MGIFTETLLLCAKLSRRCDNAKFTRDEKETINTLKDKISKYHNIGYIDLHERIILDKLADYLQDNATQIDRINAEIKKISREIRKQKAV